MLGFFRFQHFLIFQNFLYPLTISSSQCRCSATCWRKERKNYDRKWNKTIDRKGVGDTPYWSFLKKGKKKPVGKRRVNVEALPYFSVPKMLGAEKLGRPLRLHVSFTVVSTESYYCSLGSVSTWTKWVINFYKYKIIIISCQSTMTLSLEEWNYLDCSLQ